MDINYLYSVSIHNLIALKQKFRCSRANSNAVTTALFVGIEPFQCNVKTTTNFSQSQGGCHLIFTLAWPTCYQTPYLIQDNIYSYVSFLNVNMFELSALQLSRQPFFVFLLLYFPNLSLDHNQDCIYDWRNSNRSNAVIYLHHHATI